MINQNEITMNLPGSTTYMNVPEHFVRTLESLISAGKNGITEHELNAVGCPNPSEVVMALKEVGFRIDKKYRAWADSSWNYYEHMAFYFFHGWHIDIEWPHSSTDQCEDSE